MTIESNDHDKEELKMDIDNEDVSRDTSNGLTHDSNDANTDTTATTNTDANTNAPIDTTLPPASPMLDDSSIFDEPFPSLSSQPDIMSITPKQALFYLHQSLTSLIKLHENLLSNRNSPVVIDDDIIDSGSEGGVGNTDANAKIDTDNTTPLNTGNVPPPPSSASSSSFHNFRRRSHRYSDISPFSMSSRRKSSSSNIPTTSSNLNPMRSNSEEEDYDILSPSSPGSVSGGSNDIRQSTANSASTFLRRQKKSTSLLAEAAEVASLVLQGGTTLQEEYSRIKQTMIIHNSEGTSLASSPSASPSTAPVSLRPSPSTGSVSSIQEQKLAIARRFWSKTSPQITVQKYLQRLYKYCPSSTSVYLSAGLYIYRLCIILQTIPLTDFSVHRLVLAAIRVACKSIEDINHSQSRFAMAAGVSTADLYRLEIALLFLLDFNIKVDSDSLQRALEVWAEVEIQTRHVLDRPIGSPG